MTETMTKVKAGKGRTVLRLDLQLIINCLNPDTGKTGLWSHIPESGSWSHIPETGSWSHIPETGSGSHIPE